MIFPLKHVKYILNESKDFENSENRETYKENDSIGDERNVI
jgi:hypothetical protein